MADKTSNVLLKYTVDRASSQGALNSVRLLQEELGKTAKRELSVAQAADEMNQALAKLARQKALDIVAEDAAQAISQGKALNAVLKDTAEALSLVGASEDELRDVVNQLERISDLESKRASSGGAKGLGGVEQGKRVGDVGSLLSAAGGLNLLGGAGAQLGELGQLGDIVQYLPQAKQGITELAGALGTSTGGLIGVLGIGALAVVAVTVAVGEYNKALDIQREKLKGALSAQDTYYQAVGELTEDQAREEIDKRKRTNEALAQQIAETQGAIDRTFQQAQSNLSDPLARILTATGQLPTAQLEEQLKKLREEYATNEQAAGRLQQGLESGAFAANSAADAEEKLAEARQQTIQAAITDYERRRSAERDAQSFLQTATSENVQTRLEALKTERAQLDEDLRYYQGLNDEAASAAIAANRARAQEIDIWAMALQVGEDAVTLREHELATVQRFVAGAKQAVQALNDIASSAQKFAEAESEYTADIDKLANNRDARLGELADNLSRGLAGLGDDLRAQQEKQQAGDLEELRKFHEAEEDRIKQHRLALAQIERQYDNSRKDALQDRGAVELDRAERTRDEAVKNENEKFDAESEKRKKDLEDLKRSQAAERRELISNYQKRYNDLIDQHRHERDATIAKYNADVQVRQQAYQQQQTQLQNALSAELGIRQTAYNGLLAQAAAWASKMAGLTTGGGSNTTLGNIASSVFNVGKTLLGFAGGGSAPANQPVRINERGLESGMNARGDLAVFSNPMRIFNAQQTRQMLGGGGLNVPITVNGVGLSRAQVIGEVVRQLDNHLTAAGVA